MVFVMIVTEHRSLTELDLRFDIHIFANRSCNALTRNRSKRDTYTNVSVWNFEHRSGYDRPTRIAFDNGKLTAR